MGLMFSKWQEDTSVYALGVALGFADLNTDFTSVEDQFGISSEIALEISFQARINNWLSMQPYFHYIGMNDIGSDKRNPLIFALRTKISFNNFLLNPSN